MNTLRRASLAVIVCMALAGAAQSVWDGVYTAEQAKRGQPIYNKYCASCHGEQLTGGEDSPPLTGGAFLANWNGLTVGDLFERIRVSMPQDRPGRLTRQQNADILSYHTERQSISCRYSGTFFGNRTPEADPLRGEKVELCEKP